MSITVPLEGFGGGSNPLNFKVVGGLVQPENPRENTIWVNTDVPITGWIFSATKPEAPAEGMVWFTTGTFSAAEFNALKKNGLAVYPVSARQYVSGAWEKKPAALYQRGTWAELDHKLYLYKNGDSCADITGGWGANPSQTAGTLSADRMILNGSSSAPVGLSTANYIDLSEYTALHFNIKVLSVYGDDLCLQGSGIYNARTLSSADLIVGMDTAETNADRQVDISNVAGGYITFNVGKSASCKAEIYEVWLT